jgi:hypothetical protein
VLSVLLLAMELARVVFAFGEHRRKLQMPVGCEDEDIWRGVVGLDT